MKIIWIMLMLISASISASLREYAPLQDAMVDRQDGVTITQKVTAQDDGTLRIRLQIDMKEEIAALQAEAGKHSLQEVQSVDPIAIGRRESVNRLSSGLWQLHIPMCAGAYVVEADTALQVSSARDEVCFDVSAWMSGEKTLPAQAEYCIRLQGDPAYRSESGHIFQMQSRFAYVISLQKELPLVKRMYVSAPKVRMVQS